MKKLLIITGAGASVEFGMPSVLKIDSLMDEWAKSVAPLTIENASLYGWVKEKLISHITQNPNKTVNFEDILYSIQSLYGLLKDKQYQYFNHNLMPFISLNEFPDVVGFRNKIQKANAEDFHFLHSYLIDELLSYFRTRCQSLKSNKSLQMKQLSAFFESLRSEFELGFINLNYDNVVLSSLPDLKTGFNKSTEEFNQQEIFDSTWNFCYHLHGSVHFDMRGDNQYEMHKIYWNSNLGSKFSQNSSGRSGINTREGINHLHSSIITGLDKTNQILRSPFQSYYMSLDRLVFESDAILFIGYGFNDFHLNGLFSNIRYDKSKTRKVVVIDYVKDDIDELSSRFDDWRYNLFSTIPTNIDEMGDGKSKLQFSVGDFKEIKELEKSSNPNFPLAVWYDGLMSACEHSNKIITELV